MADPTNGHTLRLLAVSVGNTRVTAGVCVGREIGPVRSFDTRDSEAIGEGVRALVESSSVEAVAIASVHEAFTQELIPVLRGATRAGVYRMGSDIAMPSDGGVDPDARTGQDRLLAALAAYDILGQACVVVDAGTAITVDFVDGSGVFQGGAIAPGARMALRALEEGTSALPGVELERPGEDPFGRNTHDAMLSGVFYGARGLVRLLVERYAEAYEAYPLVIATGGDASMLFEGDELVDRIVPDLVLRGIAIACEKALGAADQA